MNTDTFMDYMTNPLNWKEIKKKDYFVWMRKVLPGFITYNTLECRNYESTETNNILISGTASETWLTSEDYVKKHYLNEDGSLIKSIGTYWVHIKSNPSSYTKMFAIKVPIGLRTLTIKNEQTGTDVIVNGTDSPLHGDGDYIISCADELGNLNLRNLRVVNCSVFEATYHFIEFTNKPKDLY